MEKKFRYLVPGDYMADPAVHVFDGKLYIYPSHDRESGVEENDNGDHFDMCDCLLAGFCIYPQPIIEAQRKAKRN